MLWCSSTIVAAVSNQSILNMMVSFFGMARTINLSLFMESEWIFCLPPGYSNKLLDRNAEWLLVSLAYLFNCFFIVG